MNHDSSFSLADWFDVHNSIFRFIMDCIERREPGDKAKGWG